MPARSRLSFHSASPAGYHRPRKTCRGPLLSQEPIMRRAWLLVVPPCLLAAGLIVYGTLPTGGARAAAKGEEGPKAAQLPIGQVVLYSSGVGYFQREGSVEGEARVDLSFPVSD